MTRSRRRLLGRAPTPRVDLIRAEAHNDEGAHCGEDALRDDVLRAIALGATDPPVLARVALETNSIEFSRWFA